MEIKNNGVPWRDGVTKDITFIVTKDCQLACKYCYLVGKNVKERMSWETAKTFIDYVLSHEDEFREESVVWDFIGGEPFLEIELIDRICDYLKLRMFELNHHWFNSYRFSFSTNGINYHTPEVQAFIKKNRDHLSIGITIDGTEKKHDLNRVWKQPMADANGLTQPSERGSYKDVVRNIPLWLSQFPDAGTKVTISSADIPYIAESVLHLFSLGIHQVNINVVFEDVWQEGDDLRFEEQLMTLADAIIDGGWYQDYACSFFSEHIGKPLDPERDNQNWCGAGRMLSVDAAGNLYAITESRPQTDYLSAYSVLYTAASDAAGNIVLLSQSDSDAVSSYLAVPGYDAAGNLVSFASYMVSDVNAPKQNELASPLTQGTATYDAKGRISSADVTKNWIDWYQGSPEAFGSQTGHMTFHYDKKNRLKTIDCVYTDGEITHHAYTYNRYGQVLTSGGYSEMYPYRTNAEEKFSYKKDGTLVKITYNDDSQVITYTY